MKQEILQTLRRTLKYHQAIGLSGYRSDGVLSQFLAKTIDAPEDNGISRKTLVLRDTAPTPEIKRVRPQPVEAGASIADIHQDVIGCTACSLYKQRTFPAPGSRPGNEPVRLLVVGDWCRVETGKGSDAIIMGEEEDVMLSRMMKAINLEEEKYFVTSVIKCGLGKGLQPKAEHVNACMGFLHRQIYALQPEAILAMGMIGTRALLNKREPLSRLRGRFYPFAVKEGKTIPLIPTYHPNYLLQNPEMKQATWSDLQLLGKHLGLLG